MFDEEFLELQDIITACDDGIQIQMWWSKYIFIQIYNY